MIAQVHSRPKSLFVLFFKVGGTTALIFLFWVAMFWLVSEKAHLSAMQFEQEGVLTDALVTRKFSETTRRASGRRSTKQYLGLEFETRGGDLITTDFPVKRTEYNSVETGDVIEVTYLQSDPREIEVTKGANLRVAHSFRKFMWFSVFASVAGIWVYGGRALDASNARKFGRRHEVTLTEVRKTGWWMFNKGYRLIWTTPSGQEGKSLKHQADNLMTFRPGDTIVVFEGKKRSWWSGDVETR